MTRSSRDSSLNSSLSAPAENQADLAQDPVRVARTALFDALAAADITKVTVEFDGYGDSGQIEEIAATGVGAAPIELPAVSIAYPHPFDPDPSWSTMPLREAIEELLYDLLSDTHSGWENDDGAYGTFVLDVAARSIRLEHHARFVDTFDSVHEF